MMNALSDYIKEQIFLHCNELGDEKLLEALETLPQLLQMLQVEETSGTTSNKDAPASRNTDKKKLRSSCQILTNRVLGRKNTPKIPKAIVIKDKNTFNETLMQLMDKLYSYGHQPIPTLNKQTEEDITMLLHGYQGILIELRKAQNQHSNSVDDAMYQIERHLEQALDRIGAEVIWEREENDYGNRFKVLKVPDDPSFQIETPCIIYNKKTVCKGIYYITAKEEE